MIKYCKILDEEKGIVQLGAGCSDEYYIEIGMKQRDVEQSEVDNEWYLAEKCPHKSEEEKFLEAKQSKYDEANSGAKTFIDSGNALYAFTETQHIEATGDNIGKFSAYALGYITGELTENVTWTTHEDEVISIGKDDVSKILTGLGMIQSQVWTIKFPYYVSLIDKATTVEEVEAIVIDYTITTEEIAKHG